MAAVAGFIPTRRSAFIPTKWLLLSRPNWDAEAELFIDSIDQIDNAAEWAAAGVRASVSTVEQAIDMIDKELQPELAQLPRWRFARALLGEALKSGKSRDVKTATRQLQQALHDEKWA